MATRKAVVIGMRRVQFDKFNHWSLTLGCSSVVASFFRLRFVKLLAKITFISQMSKLAGLREAYIANPMLSM